MFSQQSTLLSFVSLLFLAVASITSAQSLGDFPPCAQTCAQAASTVAGCSTSDRACQCKNANWQSDTLTCARKGCTNEDFSSAIGEMQSYCAGQGGPPQAPTTSSSTTSSSQNTSTTQSSTTSNTQSSTSTTVAASGTPTTRSPTIATVTTTNAAGVVTTVSVTSPPTITTPPLGNLPGSSTTSSATTVVLNTVTAEPTINAAAPAFGGANGGLGMVLLGMLGMVAVL